tara:strand:+ start:2310 stop:3068 length:759 start_codon:yes stop_codon:yes gene_type:complete
MPTSKISAKHDEAFVQWLQRIGSRKYEGNSLLSLYMKRRDNDAWGNMVGHLRTTRVDWWVFVRNHLSLDAVRGARKRYVDAFVFICQEEPSEPYIDTLLEIESRQLQLRAGTDAKDLFCPGCRRREVAILSLRERLRRLNEDVSIDERLELLRAEFRRMYVIDANAMTPIRIVREDLDSYLKRELKEEDDLLANSELWGMFLRDVIGHSVTSGGIRCRKRQNSLVTALGLSSLGWCESETSGGQKRPRSSAP